MLDDLGGLDEILAAGLPGGAIIGVLAAQGNVPAGESFRLADHSLSALSRVDRALAMAELDRHRRANGTVVIVSYDEELLSTLADEVWWVEAGRIVARGGPEEVLQAYRAHAARKLRKLAEGAVAVISPSMRRGDGRAEVQAIELLAQNGTPAMAWQSGEEALLRITVHFRNRVEDPVVGMLIRTRIGLNVYGTNTELEQLRFGPCAAGETVRIGFAFRCELCPGDYTLTVASHDPDGVWHEWLEDAVAFSVTDSRYTAGVANLRASARCERI